MAPVHLLPFRMRAVIDVIWAATLTLLASRALRLCSMCSPIRKSSQGQSCGIDSRRFHVGPIDRSGLVVFVVVSVVSAKPAPPRVTTIPNTSATVLFREVILLLSSETSIQRLGRSARGECGPLEEPTPTGANVPRQEPRTNPQ